MGATLLLAVLVAAESIPASEQARLVVIWGAPLQVSATEIARPVPLGTVLPRSVLISPPAKPTQALLRSDGSGLYAFGVVTAYLDGAAPGFDPLSGFDQPIAVSGFNPSCAGSADMLTQISTSRTLLYYEGSSPSAMFKSVGVTGTGFYVVAQQTAFGGDYSKTAPASRTVTATPLATTAIVLNQMAKPDLKVVLWCTTSSRRVEACARYKPDAGTFMLPVTYTAFDVCESPLGEVTHLQAVDKNRLDVDSCKETMPLPPPSTWPCKAPMPAALNIPAGCAMGYPAVSRKLYVDAAFAGAESGTQSAPYRTITRALGASVDGDEILVKAGRYDENIVLKPNVRVSSQTGTAGAIINGKNAGPTVRCAYKATLTGFIVTGGAPAGIDCQDQNSYILKNIIRNNRGLGIDCGNNCSAVIQNNTILSNFDVLTKKDTAIRVKNASPLARVFNNIILSTDIGFDGSLTGGQEGYNALSVSATASTGAYALGPGTTTVTPIGFESEETDDYRLSANAAQRTGGAPSCTSRTQGAFEGNGGYSLSIAAQEYARDALFTGRLSNGVVTYSRSIRWDENPKLWVDSAFRGKAYSARVQSWVEDAVVQWSRGKYHVDTLASEPANWCNVLTLNTLSATTGYRWGKGATANGAYYCFGGAPGALGGASVSLEGMPDSLYEASEWTARHETGHAMGLSHVYRTRSIMAYGMQRPDIGPTEKEALDLWLALPADGSVSAWTAAGYLSDASMHPFPHIETTIVRTGYIAGSRFTRVLGPEEYQAPQQPDTRIWLNGRVLSYDQATSANGYGSATRNLLFSIPAGEPTGWIVVEARGLFSNPVRYAP